MQLRNAPLGLLTFVLFLGHIEVRTQTPKLEDAIHAEMVVSANRQETAADQIGSSVTVITGSEIKARGYQLVADVLKEAPGLDLVSNGGPGKATSLFIRGGNSTHCLVIVDGIELNDPSSAGNAFDFGHLSVDDVERIEIVRGPQSPLYGSDAMSGVIRIFTRKGSDVPRLNAELAGGSFGSQKQFLSYADGSERFNYRVSGRHFEQDGFSAADVSQNNEEKDGYRTTEISLQAQAVLANAFRLGFSGRSQNSKSDLDSSGGIGGDDPNYVADSKQVNARLHADFQHGLRWEHQIGLALVDAKREYVNEPDPQNPGSSLSTFHGQKVKMDWQHLLNLDAHRLVFGAETEEEQADTSYFSDGPFGPYSSVFHEQSARTTGLFLQDHFQVGSHLHFTVGGRIDDHDRFGSKATWRATSAWRPGGRNTLLRGSVGTGFKAPSLYQLYSNFGDLNLKAEEALSWDVGVEQTFLGLNLLLQATWFQSDYEQLIDYDSASFSYSNIAEAETQGLEFSVRWQPSDGFFASLNYTHMFAEDGLTGLRLTRRPDQKGNAQLGWRFKNQAHVTAQARYVGDRDFEDFSTYPASLKTLGGHTVWDLSGGVSLNHSIRLGARLENLFDKDYQEVLGYGTPGISGRISLNFTY